VLKLTLGWPLSVIERLGVAVQVLLSDWLKGVAVSEAVKGADGDAVGGAE
jgi:hypothetical protein